MTRPLLLDRRLGAPGEVRELPAHHYDSDRCVNVVDDGRALIHAADPGLVADYTRTQEPSGIKTDD